MSAAPRPQGKSLGNIYKNFVVEASRHFPHLRGRLLILDMNEYAAYGHWYIDKKATGLTPETALAYLAGIPEVLKMRKDPTLPSCALSFTDRDLHVILVNDRIDKAGFRGVSRETEMYINCVLDHELGHPAVRDGNSTNGGLHAKVVADSVADAYALLRHYQRFGVDNGYRDSAIDPAVRTANMVLDIGKGKGHFTAFVLEEIIRRRHIINFNALDPAATADLAWRFAMRYLPPTPVIERLYKTFAPVKAAFRSSPERGVKALINITLNPDTGYYTFKCGASWLRRYLEDRTFLNGQPINLPKGYLDGAARLLRQTEFRLAREDILFNLPEKAATRPQRAPRAAGPFI